MKKIVTIAALALAGSMGTAHADNTGAGCGLGQQVFKGQSGLFAHVAAATTNGTFMNQWFGLSFGSLGCDATSTVSNEYLKKTFVASNMDNLADDVAKGQGEYLSSLANLMGIQDQDKQRFFDVAQNNYDSIFGSNGSQEIVLSALDNAMSQDQQLVKYVQ